MPLSKRDADRCLHLLWDCRSHSQAPKQRQAYGQAIASLHAYLTDVLPATLPCVRAKSLHGGPGVVEIFPDQDARVQDIDLCVEEGEKLGIVLDSVDVNEWCGAVSSNASPIAIALLRPNSVAAKDGRLARGDQVLYINSHSLSQVSLQRARWLLDSAERSHQVALSIITSGLMDGLKHSISRHDIISLTPRLSHQSKIYDSKRRVKRLLSHRIEAGPKSQLEKKPSPKKDSSHTSLHDKAGYAPSIGSRHGSDFSLVSSTVETAAHIARSSIRSSETAAKEVKQKRKVKKMHIMKGMSGLGLRIIGGKGSKYGDMGILVSQLEEGGAAFDDGRLHPGDELLMVDGKTLVGQSHDEAVAILKATQKLVQLVVATEHPEGESINSSLQSIPENLANIINLSAGGVLDRQQQQESGLSPTRGHAVTTSEPAVIVPEVFLSPQRNAFEKEHTKGLEMKNMAAPKQHLPEQVETKMEDRSVQSIKVTRSDGQPLGIKIKECYSERSGRKGIFVFAIDSDGAVGRGKEVSEGDELLEVNGISLEASTQQEALTILTGMKGEVLTLQVATKSSCRSNDHVLAGEKKEILLHKSPGRPLGIKLTAGDALIREAIQHKQTTMAVTIQNIAPGSPAYANGKLCVGDQLVSVNGMSVLGMRVEQVKALLFSIPGEEIKLVVFSTPNTSLRSNSVIDEKTTTEQNFEGAYHPDDQAVSQDEEMELTTGLSEPPPSLHRAPAFEEASIVPPSRNTVDTSEEDSGDDSITGNVISQIKRVPQSTQSRPESTIIEISGHFNQQISSQRSSDEAPSSSPLLPASSQQLQPHSNSPQSVHASSFTPDSPPVPCYLPDAPPSPSSSLSPSPPPSPTLAQPPVGFTSMQFKLKKRPGGGIGITLVASEGPTVGFFMVRRIAASGVAAKDGRIQIGDRLISVNEVSLFGFPHAAILQTLSEANKDMELVVWRDLTPNPTSASMRSLSSYSNLSGSHSSLLLEEVNVNSSPSLRTRKFQHSQGLPSPAAQDSPLATRFSYAGVDTPPLRESIQDQRWNDVLTGYSKSSLEDTSNQLSLLPTPSSLPSDELSTTVPPALPDTTPPLELPEPPTTPPPKIPSEFLPELATNITPAESPTVPFSNVNPPMPPYESPKVLHFEPPELCLSEPPELLLSESPEKSPSDFEEPADSRPPSLQVPRGARVESSPFEIELKKGLFGIGASLALNQMGMLAIESLSSRSVISQEGNIRVGDILLSINNQSVVGLSAEKAQDYLKRLPRGPFTLTVMAPPRDVTGEGTIMTPSGQPHSPSSVQPPKEEELAAESKNPSKEEDIRIDDERESPEKSADLIKADNVDDVLRSHNITDTELMHATSTDILTDARSSNGLVKAKSTSTDELAKVSNSDLYPQAEKAIQLVPQEKMTIELRRGPREKLGIGIVGGRDNPNLETVHVKQTVPGGVAAYDGRLKRGDHIISVNGHSTNGLSNKEALQMLKESGKYVTLVVARKVGRRASIVSTPLTSVFHSRQGSGDNSCIESRKMSPLHSPKTSHRRGHGTGSSDEGSRESSQNASPQRSRKHSTWSHRDKTSTLPRQIKGDKAGVHLVELHKGPTGLGLQLQGSTDPCTPIRVKAVLSGGTAFKSGKIHEGDELIQVNGTPFENLNLQDALKVMKELPQGKVSIILRDHKQGSLSQS